MIQLANPSHIRPQLLCLSVLVALVLFLGHHSLQAQDASDKSAAPAGDLELYEKTIKPLLMKSCYECHSEDEAEGGFRADELDPDLVNGEDLAWWLEVYSVVGKGEMPPDSVEFSDAQRTLLVDWLANQIQAAEKHRKSNANHSPFRRLTRYEYNYALQDLLGVPWTFADELPAETSEEDAFENNAHSLRMSVKQVQAYHRLALQALKRVTVAGEQPPMLHWSISMKTAAERAKKIYAEEVEAAEKKYQDDPKALASQLKWLEENKFKTSADQTHYLELPSGRMSKIYWKYPHAKYAFPYSDAYQPMPKLESHFAVVQPGSRKSLVVELGDQLPDQGTMRVRVRASKAKGASQRAPSLQLWYGFRATDQGGATKRISQHDIQIDAPFGKPQVYQWEVPLSEIEYRNPYRVEWKLGVKKPSPSEYIRFTNTTLGPASEGEESSAILIDHVEVAAPVYSQWPPQSHRDLFVESENSQEKKNETAYAKEIITAFMSRSWRQTPSSRDVDRKLKLFEQVRSSSPNFQEAIIEVLATVLSSPKFLYVLPGSGPGAPFVVPAVGGNDAKYGGTSNRISQNELATRLSLFLWCSLPDETLIKLAAAGRLDQQDVLREQVERMLADPRAKRFNKHFVEQWLKMRPLQYLTPTKGNRVLSTTLLDSMRQEPIALFADMLERDSSVMDFIRSKYLVINERLAMHYGIDGVEGNHFRRIALPAEMKRGGLLTQAGLLTMNSDGKDSHPVKRGVWLLTSLLNDPPPSPPAAVPEIDLADPEIAKMTLKERIENHRDQAACFSCHQKIDPWGIAFENFDAFGRWRKEIDGKEIDASSELSNKVLLDGIEGLQKHLIEDRQEDFVRATVEKMASFSLGRQLHFGDRAAITKLTQQVLDSGDGIKTMVMSLVTSELFQSK